MKKAIVAMAIAAAAGGAYAQKAGDVSATGMLTVFGSIYPSIQLTMENAGGLTSGDMHTPSAWADMGSLTRYGDVPTGFTKAFGSTDYTHTGSVSVAVNKANYPESADYILKAKIGSTPPIGVTWKLGSQTLNSSTDSTLTSSGAYASLTAYELAVVIANTAAHGDIGNTINFTAIGN